MDIHTDFKKNLLDTDRIDEVEFEEYKNYSDNNDRKHNGYNVQYMNDNANYHYSGQNNETDRNNFENDKYDSDYVKQFGGKNENINYMDDYTSSQYNSKRLESYEKDFMDLYNKAREFRQRVINVENEHNDINRNQYGGQGENGEKKKRPLPPAIRLMQELSKIMRESGKYSEFKPAQLIKISKMIVDDAKKQTGMQEINETVRQAALQIVKNPDEYIKRFKNEQASLGNSNNSSSSNSRSNSNKSKKFQNDRNQSSKDQNNINDTNSTWRGSDSNYRTYAQADLWNDKNQSNKPSNDREINRYGTVSYRADIRNDDNDDYQLELDETNYDVVDRVQKINKNKSREINKNTNKYKKKSNFMY